MLLTISLPQALWQAPKHYDKPTAGPLCSDSCALAVTEAVYVGAVCKKINCIAPQFALTCLPFPPSLRTLITHAMLPTLRSIARNRARLIALGIPQAVEGLVKMMPQKNKK